MKGYTIQNSIDLLEKQVDKIGSGGSGGGGTADSVTYVNTTSGLTATNVQAAIDEVDGNLDTLSGDVTTLLNGHVYSTTEHIVGKWIDGRDIFEKTLYISALPSAAGVGTYSLDTENAEMSWLVNAITSQGGDVSNVRIDFTTYESCQAPSLFVRTVAESGDVKVYINVGRDRSGLSAYVTAQYVKTAPTRKSKKNKED